MHKITAAFAVAVAAATLAACGAASRGGAQRPAGSPEVHPRWPSCAAEAPDAGPGGAEAIQLPRIGDGFAAAAVVVCADKHQRRPDGGEDLVAVESRGTDVTALVAALRLPDEARTNDLCTADLPIVPWFALLDDQDRWIRPGLPQDACGKIRIEVREALGELRLSTVSSRVIRELESAEAVAAGCAQSWADMISVETTQGTVARPHEGVDPFPAGTRVRLCVYRVPAEQQGTGKPAGDFQHGGILSAGPQAAIEAAGGRGRPGGTVLDPGRPVRRAAAGGREQR